MMRRWALLALVAFATWGVEGRAQEEGGAVTDYEVRLEQISREILEIRRDLDALVEEVVVQEKARVFIFLGNAPARLVEAGASLAVDGKTVFSRPFTSAERDVLDKGLPLELAELHLPPGAHFATVGVLGGDVSEPQPVAVEGVGITSWVALVGESGVEWQVE